MLAVPPAVIEHSWPIATTTLHCYYAVHFTAIAIEAITVAAAITALFLLIMLTKRIITATMWGFTIAAYPKLTIWMILHCSILHSSNVAASFHFDAAIHYFHSFIAIHSSCHATTHF